MSNSLYLFTQDLRLCDNPALSEACRYSDALLPVFFMPESQPATRWGFPRRHPRRQHFLLQALSHLQSALQSQGSDLWIFDEQPQTLLSDLLKRTKADAIYCQTPVTPGEKDFLHSLRSAGLPIKALFQSTLYHPEQLPFLPEALPDSFTPFRRQLEKQGELPIAPLPAAKLPPLPEGIQLPNPTVLRPPRGEDDSRSSFPFNSPRFYGGATAALTHLTDWFSDQRARDYKATRNGLTGIDFSSKFSPWLASGALSARQIYACCREYAARHGENDGTTWLTFELLWRDYFFFLQMKYGSRLWRANGISQREWPQPDMKNFAAWCSGMTGSDLVDAAMHELRATGYLSNRLRQVVASYLIYDLEGDWRAGAAWFEHHLIDFCPAINQGNWLYIAGRGTDPRGGRHFNVAHQAAQYDSDGSYRRLWGNE